MTLNVNHLTTTIKISLPNTHADIASNPISRLAIFIDTNNAQYSVVRFLLRKIEKYGTAHVKRAYGDWTNPNTINLLHSNHFDAFCLVSSDTRTKLLHRNTLVEKDEIDDLNTQKQDNKKDLPNNSGWARLSDVGEHLSTQYLEFDISTQGHLKLSKVFTDSPEFDIEHRVPQGSETWEFYVRKKETIPEFAHK
ncbi:unnamed protein product [Penicillium salamii]|nr:unnamed protein product [Penicillium salamii]CAG8295985.1 unnamed protein product [Penicillium salamii]